MAMQDIDLEKQPLVTSTPFPDSPPETPLFTTTSSCDNTLKIYQTLVGDVSIRPPRSGQAPVDPSLYQDITRRARAAGRLYIFSAVAFALCISAQIILCLAIAIGAQLGFTKDTISIAAGINTAVAAAIGILKGLGLPEKPAIEKHKLQKIADKIRFTTRKIRAGLVVDAAKEAEEARKAEEDAEDEGQVLRNVGDAAGVAVVPSTPLQ